MASFGGRAPDYCRFISNGALTAGPVYRRRAVQIYLPIADLPVNIFLVFAHGVAVGFISGMFGIGGGFLMTPLLIFIGISPSVAVATVSSHIAASSFSSAITYWRRNAIDLPLAMMLLVGGVSARRRAYGVFTLLRRSASSTSPSACPTSCCSPRSAR